MFTEQSANDNCLEVEDKTRVTNEKEIIEIAKQICKVDGLDEIQRLDKKARDYCLSKIKQEGLSVRQIEKPTGINRRVVLKA